MIVLIVAVYAVFIFLDMRQDRHSRKPWVVWPCLALFAAGFVIQALHEFSINLPSPAAPISNFLTGAFGLR